MNVYIERWEVWSTANYKLLKYDTDNLRKSFQEMADWDDEKIKQYLEDNDGNIEFNDAHDKSGEWMDVSEDAHLQIEENQYQFDEVSDLGCQVFSNAEEWESRASWWRGGRSHDLRCEDRSKDCNEIMNNFLTTMKTYKFEEWVDEEEEE